ncbi:putative H/ACA ribonucleoprotein complex subunit 1-like protein 1-like [Hibiscus syriacus]|uniref:H/ACA ribonucleoprotein complex subunit 1-like protein 1-like n=1 Tax=Hibiscus syriacus TaxID=106335 RepID=A0A6A2YZ17_HIBSY|nr:putative H/ACA ribonucleoprotein complex subunit 1-like protein 1-like [Hibiscus syriacus]
MKALKSYVRDLDSKEIPVFLAQIVPQIDSIMSTIIKTLASSAGSFPLQQACSKVVPAIARYGIDPTTPADKKRHIIHSLCNPLSESLLGSQESLSSGAALCLKALVESDNWSLLPMTWSPMFICNSPSDLLSNHGSELTDELSGFLHRSPRNGVARSATPSPQRSRSQINVDNLFTTPRRLICSLQDPNELNSGYSEKQYRRFRSPAQKILDPVQPQAAIVISVVLSISPAELDVRGPNVADLVNKKECLEFRNDKAITIEALQGTRAGSKIQISLLKMDMRVRNSMTTDNTRKFTEYREGINGNKGIVQMTNKVLLVAVSQLKEKWAKNPLHRFVTGGQSAHSVFVLSLSFIGSFPCLHEQRDALLEFKDFLVQDSTRDDNSTDLVLGGLETWNSSSECCQWALVECGSSSSSQHVIGLNLSSVFPTLGKTSDVLAPIFWIKTLTSLDVSYNSIQGAIPGIGLRNLSELVHLDMRGNSFNGSIPLQLFNLTNLEFLDLSDNMIEGGLPNDFVGLKSLKQLSLDANFIHGELPEEFGSLAELRKLTVSSNRISGRIPLSILQLAKLEVLILQNNTLSMEIPLGIGNLVNLTTLDLSKNLLSGEIPSSVRKLRKLETLQLENNMLSDGIPAWLFELKELKKLHLGGNRLAWNNSLKIEPMCKLSSLSLRSCSVRGEIPRWISNQTDLIFLDLSENDLEGEFPLWLAAERSLGTIILSDNKLSGSLPPQLFQSRNLSILVLSRNKLLLLDLSNNSFSGSEFPAFGPNSLIAYVDISSNNFSGKVPVDFGLFTSMLSLSQNGFSGPLPENFSNLTMLEHLDLHDNNISGEFPAFFSQLSSLQVLNLRNNSIDGLISNDLSSLSSLRILDLSNNNLNGEIPQSLGNLTGMIDTPDVPVALSDFFNFPVEIHDLIVNWKKSKQGLSIRNRDIYTFLDLSKNQLSGGIPHSLGTISELQELNYLDLSNNELSGKIPEGPQMDRLVDLWIYANNSGLCGVQIQVPCEEDSVPPGLPSMKKQETMFSWVAAAIGYPTGFLCSTAVMYVIGYFNCAPSRRHRGRRTSPRR